MPTFTKITTILNYMGNSRVPDEKSFNRQYQESMTGNMNQTIHFLENEHLSNTHKNR